MYRLRLGGQRGSWEFFLLDVVLLQVSFFLPSYFILHLANYTFFNIYRNQAVILVLCVFVQSYVGNPYESILRRSTGREMRELIRSALMMGLLNLALLYFIHVGQHMSRAVFLVTWGLYILFGLPCRTILKKICMHMQGGAAHARSMVVLTTASRLEKVLTELSSQVMGGYFVCAVFLPEGEPIPDLPDAPPIYHGYQAALDYACHHWVDEAFLRFSQSDADQDAVREGFLTMGIPVHCYMGTVKKGKSQDTVIVDRFGDMVASTWSVRNFGVREALAKRALDIAGSLLGCLATLLILPFVGVAIKLHSPGPIFFSQQRIGRSGKPFTMYKFRTMVLGAEEQKDALRSQNLSPDGMMFKIEEDPRIIGSGKRDKKGRPGGVGHFLRRTSLDEFPQFFNVLLGQMSLVGTRPPTMDEWERYQSRHRARMSAKPGITGAWQVSGRGENLPFDEIVRLDEQYIRNWSFGGDLRILWKTVKVVLSEKGAL